MKTRQAIIKLAIPVIAKEEQGGNIIPFTYDVKGMIKILESQIASYMATDNKLSKPDKGTRYEEALFMLHELRKFYLADAADVKVMPETEK